MGLTEWGQNEAEQLLRNLTELHPLIQVFHTAYWPLKTNSAI